MTRNQLTNLISYYILFKSDKNYLSNIDYIVEKYDLFFNNKPSIDILKHYEENIKNMDFISDIVMTMNHWKISTLNKNFDKYYFTYYLCKLDENVVSYKEVIKIYNEFFNIDSINKELKIDILHPVLRNMIYKFISNNIMLYRISFIKELLNKNKQDRTL